MYFSPSGAFLVVGRDSLPSKSEPLLPYPAPCRVIIWVPSGSFQAVSDQLAFAQLEYSHVAVLVTFPPTIFRHCVGAVAHAAIAAPGQVAIIVTIIPTSMLFNFRTSTTVVDTRGLC